MWIRQFMQAYCLEHPQYNFVGIDYRFKRSYALAKKLSELPHEEKNFCLLRAKGERVAHIFGKNEVDRLFYFFPDPWPKTRHHKKRLFQAPFLEEVQKVLKPGGEICIKTDHDGYAEWMQSSSLNRTLSIVFWLQRPQRRISRPLFKQIYNKI